MLILDRSINESIRIGDNIVIVFNGFATLNQVKLAIHAPRNIHIIRDELIPKIKTKIKYKRKRIIEEFTA